MPWIKRKLRGNQVFVRVGKDGAPLANERGLVDVIYKLQGNAKIYRAAAANLHPTGKAGDETPFDTDDAPPPQSADESASASASSGNGKKISAARGSKSATPSAPIPEDAIIIYTDGACSGNPGPMGIGAVIVDDGERTEISEYLGTGTNNIAELTAIMRALEVIPAERRSAPVVVHSDSSYSIGLLDKGWKAKANKELVASIRQLTKKFPKLRFVKVKGHAGIPENERCDELATSAISAR